MVVKEPYRRTTAAAYGKRITAGSAASSDGTGTSSARRVSSIRGATAGDTGSEVSSASSRPGRASYIRPAAGATGSAASTPARSQRRTLINSGTSGPQGVPVDNPIGSRPSSPNPSTSARRSGTSVPQGAPVDNPIGPRPTRPNPSTSAPPSGINRLAVKEFCESLRADPRLKGSTNLIKLLDSAVERIGGEERDINAYLHSLEREFKAFAGPGGFNGIKAGSPIGDRMLKSLYSAEKRSAEFLIESGQTIWDEPKLKALHRVVRSIDGYFDSAVRDISSVFSYFHPEVTSHEMKKKMKSLRTKAVDGNFCYRALIDMFGPDLVWTDSMNAKLITSIGVSLAKVNLEDVDDMWLMVEAERGASDLVLEFTVDDVKCRIKFWQINIQHYDQAKAKLAKSRECAPVQDAIDLD